MMTMHILDELDELKATLRMLIELSLNLQGMNVTWLYRARAIVSGDPLLTHRIKRLLRRAWLSHTMLRDPDQITR